MVTSALFIAWSGIKHQFIKLLVKRWFQIALCIISHYRTYEGLVAYNIYEKFEDIKVVIRIRKSKNTEESEVIVFVVEFCF